MGSLTEEKLNWERTFLLFHRFIIDCYEQRLCDCRWAESSEGLIKREETG